MASQSQQFQMRNLSDIRRQRQELEQKQAARNRAEESQRYLKSENKKYNLNSKNDEAWTIMKQIFNLDQIQQQHRHKEIQRISGKIKSYTIKKSSHHRPDSKELILNRISIIHQKIYNMLLHFYNKHTYPEGYTPDTLLIHTYTLNELNSQLDFLLMELDNARYTYDEFRKLLERHNVLDNFILGFETILNLIDHGKIFQIRHRLKAKKYQKRREVDENKRRLLETIQPGLERFVNYMKQINYLQQQQQQQQKQITHHNDGS
jgi:GGDEF domain-containing protein